jgi:hypothetical protein
VWENRYFEGMISTRPFRVWAVAAAVGMFAVGCERELSEKAFAPEFELRDLSGNAVALAGLRGQVVLIGFWAVR